MNTGNKHALVVEDNADLARLVQLHLHDQEISSDSANNGADAISLFRQKKYDLLVLDIMLPELDGLEVCKQVRVMDQQVPILMLTAKSDEIDKVVGLELGADDYLTKPFGVAELTARIRALLRRCQRRETKQQVNFSVSVAQGLLELDEQRHEARLAGKLLTLTAREFELLGYFVRHPGQVFTRTELLEKVWGYSNGIYQHTVNSHINRLRAKIEQDPVNPQTIVTIWGVGYKLAA